MLCMLLRALMFVVNVCLVCVCVNNVCARVCRMRSDIEKNDKHLLLISQHVNVLIQHKIYEHTQGRTEKLKRGWGGRIWIKIKSFCEILQKMSQRGGRIVAPLCTLYAYEHTHIHKHTHTRWKRTYRTLEHKFF